MWRVWQNRRSLIQVYRETVLHHQLYRTKWRFTLPFYTPTYINYQWSWCWIQLCIYWSGSQNERPTVKVVTNKKETVWQGICMSNNCIIHHILHQPGIWSVILIVLYYTYYIFLWTGPAAADDTDESDASPVFHRSSWVNSQAVIEGEDVNLQRLPFDIASYIVLHGDMTIVNCAKNLINVLY